VHVWTPVCLINHDLPPKTEMYPIDSLFLVFYHRMTVGGTIPSLNLSRQPEDLGTPVSVYAQLSVCTLVKVLQTCDRTSGEHTCHGKLWLRFSDRLSAILD